MCKPENNFKFCTCSNKETLAKGEFIWKLTRFIKNYNSGIMGTIIMPIIDLGEGVTVKSILTFLNSTTNPFDFEYDPLEKDCLEIRKGSMDYFEVIYLNGFWREGGNRVFSSKVKTLKKGILKREEQ